MGRKGELEPGRLLLRNAYAEGLAAYRARRWDDARTAFARALEAVADDGPSMTFIDRINRFKQDPPPADWDGAWRLESK
jgi:adenylate cyclase